MPNFPTHLIAVSHYHQAPGIQPRPSDLQRGVQIVEILTGGRGWIWHEEHWREVRAGDFLWHEVGERTISRSDESDPYRCLAIRFQMPRSAVRQTPRLLFWQDLEKLDAFTREAVTLFVDETFPRDVLVHYLYAVLLREACDHTRRSQAENLPPAIQRVIHHVQQHYASPLPVSELAAIAGWSIPHLHVKLTQVLGTSPHGLVLTHRLRAARERLASTSDPLKQIAADCGFPHASALCHHFRKATGLTPSAFRQKALHS
jgi:AraC-like DNA-binding protein